MVHPDQAEGVEQGQFDGDGRSQWGGSQLSELVVRRGLFTYEASLLSGLIIYKDTNVICVMRVGHESHLAYQRLK